MWVSARMDSNFLVNKDSGIPQRSQRHSGQKRGHSTMDFTDVALDAPITCPSKAVQEALEADLLCLRIAPGAWRGSWQIYLQQNLQKRTSTPSCLRRTKLTRTATPSWRTPRTLLRCRTTRTTTSSSTPNYELKLDRKPTTM